jgi:hypothetical protein
MADSFLHFKDSVKIGMLVLGLAGVSLTKLANADSFAKYEINQDINCSSKNIIYLITCRKCHVLHVGETERRLKDRLNAHRSNIRTKRCFGISIHFNSILRNQNDISIIPIEQIFCNGEDKGSAIRKTKEKLWIQELKTSYIQMD